MAFVANLKKLTFVVTAIPLLYFAFLSLLLNENVQRHALYAHKINAAWWQDLNEPEQWGFLKNQVQAFNLTTPDGEVLYAWHILPISLYSKNQNALILEPSGPASDSSNSIATRLLRDDPESRLVISFHGNAGSVSQGWRTDTYRALAAAAADKVHVLTVDYRGFGYSTGCPTEAGLIIDGTTLVNWALEIANIPPERIIVEGQSLGTAVATAVIEYFVVEQHIEFAGIALIAAFSDLSSLLLTYAAGGVVPFLSPLRMIPKAQQFVSSKLKDTWNTRNRLANIVRHSQKLNLIIIHAINDYDIPWSHSNTLFYAAANATSAQGLSSRQIDGVKQHIDLGAQGWTNTWLAATNQYGLRRIQQVILRRGGHNRIMTYASITKAVLELFKL